MIRVPHHNCHVWGRKKSMSIDLYNICRGSSSDLEKFEVLTSLEGGEKIEYYELPKHFKLLIVFLIFWD